MQTFAEQLSAMRKERSVTQEQLAQAMNVSRTTISRWESGKVLPDIETVKRLSQVMNYNFFSVEGLVEESPAAPADAPVEEPSVEPITPPVQEMPGSVPPPAVCRRRKPWLAAVVSVCLLAACLFLLAGGGEKASDQAANAGPVETESAAAEVTSAPSEVQTESAEIVVTPSKTVVTPSKTVAYLEHFPADSGKTGYGWDVNFTFENRSDVGFTPEKGVGYF